MTKSTKLISNGRNFKIFMGRRPRTPLVLSAPCSRYENGTSTQPRTQAISLMLGIDPGYEDDQGHTILVPRASRPHASSLGPGTHRTGTARKLALISNAHGN